MKKKILIANLVVMTGFLWVVFSCISTNRQENESGAKFQRIVAQLYSKTIPRSEVLSQLGPPSSDPDPKLYLEDSFADWGSFDSKCKIVYVYEMHVRCSLPWETATISRVFGFNKEDNVCAYIELFQ